MTRLIRSFFNLDLPSAESPSRTLAAFILAACLLVCFWGDRRLVNQAALAVLAATALFVWGSGRAVFKNRPPWRLNLAWALWILAGLASLPAALNFDYSLKAVRHDLLAPAVLFYCSALSSTEERQFKIIWGAVLVGSLVLAVSGLGQYVAIASETPEGLWASLGLVRIYGLESQSQIHFYLLRLFASFPFWLLAVGLAPTRGRRLALILGTLTVAAGWLLGYGRVQIILLPFLVFLFPLTARGRPRQLHAVAGLALTASLALAAYMTLAAPTFSSEDLAIRQFFWRVSANYIQESPWIGIGFGHVAYEHLDVAEYMAGLQGQYAGHHPHNMLVNAWLTTGLPGLMALIYLTAMIYLTVLPSALSRNPASRIMNSWSRAFLIAMIMVALINVSDSLLTANNLDLLAILAGSATAAARTARAEARGAGAWTRSDAK